jgi:hypothetical protein
VRRCEVDELVPHHDEAANRGGLVRFALFAFVTQKLAELAIEKVQSGARGARRAAARIRGRPGRAMAKQATYFFGR